MTIGQALRELGAVVDELEAGGADVVSVAIDDAERAGEGLSATVEVAVRLLGNHEPGDAEVTAGEARLGEDGRLTLDLGVEIRGDVAGPPEGSVAADGPGTAPEDTAGAATEPPDETAHQEEADVPDGASRESDGGPPHRDPARLREVYDPSRTFAEMTEALGADVTPQTVRRNMIKHGIHDPVTTGSAGEGDGDPPDGSDGSGEDADDATTALADGIDLPAATSLDDIKDAVRSGRTLYEVQTRLGVDRTRARRILRELGLLGLVAGRLQTGDREVTEAEIEERIKAATPTSS